MMLKAKRSGRLYGRKAAESTMIAARTELCEIASCRRSLWRHDPTTGRKHSFVGQIDHIISERWVRRFAKGKNPSRRDNLIALCRHCHGAKTAVDVYLFGGNRITFERELLCLGWDAERIGRAFASIA